MAIFLFNVLGSSVGRTEDYTSKQSADEETNLRRKKQSLNTRGQWKTWLCTNRMPAVGMACGGERWTDMENRILSSSLQLLQVIFYVCSSFFSSAKCADFYEISCETSSHLIFYYEALWCNLQGWAPGLPGGGALKTSREPTHLLRLFGLIRCSLLRPIKFKSYLWYGNMNCVFSLL